MNAGDEITVTNDSNVDAYIRAAIVVNWMDEIGENVYGIAPNERDYAIEIDNTDWVKAGEYYYYKSSVTGNGTTNPLVKGLTVNTASPAEGYELTVEVVAEAIQANPKTTVEAVWEDVTVNSDGGLKVN